MKPLRPIRTKREYLAVLKEVESLWDSREGTADADRLEVLVRAVEIYEQKQFQIEAPPPIDLPRKTMGR